MKLIINVGNKESAIQNIERMINNNYVSFDIEITNSHIKNINVLTGLNIFKKDSLYINSNTLKELTITRAGKGSHNYHGLTSGDIFFALSSIKSPEYIFEEKDNRISIITSDNSHFNIPLMVIIEKDSGLILDINASVNKIVTIYPKSKINKHANHRVCLYKKMSTNTGSNCLN